MSATPKTLAAALFSIRTSGEREWVISGTWGGFSNQVSSAFVADAQSEVRRAIAAAIEEHTAQATAALRAIAQDVAQWGDWMSALNREEAKALLARAREALFAEAAEKRREAAAAEAAPAPPSAIGSECRLCGAVVPDGITHPAEDCVATMRLLLTACEAARDAALARAASAERGWDACRAGKPIDDRILAAGVQQKRAEEYKRARDEAREEIARLTRERDELAAKNAAHAAAHARCCIGKAPS